MSEAQYLPVQCDGCEAVYLGSISSMGVVTVLWALYGYSMAFGNDVGAGLLGNPFEYLEIGRAHV